MRLTRWAGFAVAAATVVAAHGVTAVAAPLGDAVRSSRDAVAPIGDPVGDQADGRADIVEATARSSAAGVVFAGVKVRTFTDPRTDPVWDFLGAGPRWDFDVDGDGVTDYGAILYVIDGSVVMEIADVEVGPLDCPAGGSWSPDMAEFSVWFDDSCIGNPQSFRWSVDMHYDSFEDRAPDSGWNGPVLNEGFAPAATPSSSLATVVPARLMETRSLTLGATIDGRSSGIGRRAAGSVTELTVTGRGGVAADASAVLVNVTAVSPAGPGFLTVWPCGTDRPLASNVNYSAGQIVPNAVLAKVGTGGKVCIYTLAATDVIVDVSGYVPSTGTLTSVVPGRLLETRVGGDTADGQFNAIGRRAAESQTELQVAGRGGVPADATAVVLNVTAVFPDGPGFVTVWPCGAERPLASNVNYAAGQVVPNAVIAKVGAGGKVCFYTSSGSDLLVDVNGYVPAVGAPVPVVPARLLESRPASVGFTVDGQFLGLGRRPAGSVTELVVAGRGLVPADATAVLLNVTAVFPDGPGFLTVFPCGAGQPDASNVNYGAGQVVANAVLAKVGSDGKVCIFTLAETDIIADVNGYVPA